MKAAPRVLDVKSTIEGEKIAMSIDVDSFAHIMGVLTDLYSDPELAVIREYSTNAYDAHIEAGINRPIEVTLPSSLSLYLKIRDYGIGLDRDDIAQIYSQYGASTKRNSNDVVGMLGLGCKSALTYTDQFTVTGWKNGICTQIAVSRDEDGSGSMTVLDQYESDEESGVEIMIPTRPYNQFETKANSFFKFWSDGTVLVNGKEPNKISDDGIWLNEKLYLTKDKTISKPVVVMGNVAYPLPETQDHDFTYGQYGNTYNLVAFVDIGEVNFVPSREALQMTPQTKATIANLGDTVKNLLTDVLIKRIQRASSKRDAIRALFEAKGLINLPAGIKWNGHEIPVKFVGKFISIGRLNGSRFSRYDWNKYDEYSSNTDYIWFTGYEMTDLTSTKKKKLRAYLNQHNIVTEGAILVSELPEHSSWIDKTKIHNWDDVKSIKIDSGNKPTGVRLTGSYDFLTAAGRTYEVPAEDINKIVKSQLYWVTPLTKAEIQYSYNNRWRYHSDGYDPDGVKHKALFFELHPNAVVVLLPKNRVEKFKRDFPHAKNMVETLKDEAIKWEKSVSPANKLSYTLQNGDEAHLKHLDASNIHDPKLKHLINAAKRDIESIQAQVKKWSGFVTLRDIKFDSPFVKYPLLGNIDLTSIDSSAMVHVELYVNAVHAAGKDK